MMEFLLALLAFVVPVAMLVDVNIRIRRVLRSANREGE